MEALLYSDNIVFSDIDVRSNLKQKKRLRNWILQCINSERKKCSSIEFNFCSDEYLIQINREYLNHDYYTDIITFDFTQGKSVSGDIYISLDRVKENAKDIKTPISRELERVIIHGVLHLCGYKDKTKKDQVRMREKEDHYLSLLP